ncbi:MAG: glutamate dehydrogenase, partial [Chloroflexi bacterium]|nr:glutamate dehydrogenase [Chloroflexota bacterium]
GLKVVAVSDSKGGVRNPHGLDFEPTVAWKLKNGSLTDLPNSEPISNPDLLELPVTVLFPAGVENQIHAGNASRIKAKVVAELANGPTTPDADRILYDNSVYVIPDFLCNAGGVTVSYFEMVQNADRFTWSLSDVHRRLDDRMTASFRAVHHTIEERKVHPRLAAYMVSVSRVVEAMKLRGWV